MEKVKEDTQILEDEGQKTNDTNGGRISLLLERLPTLREIFEVVRKIGEGTFSSVYLIEEKTSGRKYALKHLIPTCHPSRILRELSCMREMGGAENVVEVYMCLRKEDCIAFVMPFQDHDKFTSYVYDMDVDETRLYLRELLVAVRRVHSFGIIHRDIKPSNFLYNRNRKEFLLVDFGLAQKVEECMAVSEDGENLSSKKRKREEDVELGSDSQPLKRPALQQLSSNFISLSENNGKKSSQDPKRFPFSALNRPTSKSSQMNNVRVQNSQLISGCEKIFAKPQVPSKKCYCDGRARICNICVTRKAQNAPRAGTPGFRPPEVLLKTLNQTTAVDIWAVGVMLLCIMSGTYPFFKSPDDVTALAEIISIFGTENLKNIAKKLGRNIVCSEERPPVDLRKMCERLRRRKTSTKRKSVGICSRCKTEVLEMEGCLCPGDEGKARVSGQYSFPEEAYDLLRRLLDLDPTTRITAQEALEHPFISQLSES